MKNYTVLTMGDPQLRLKSLPVKDFEDPGVEVLINNMVQVMRNSMGVGLAAPQIGVAKRIVCIEVNNNKRYPEACHIALRILINPEIINTSEEVELGWEGCLSVPGMRGKVSRHASIKFRAQNPDGSAYEELASGFFARIIQHEVDHLDGILYPDRLDNKLDFGFERSLPEFNRAD